MEARMLYVHALSPIHVGIGQGAGVIDLPVIREAVTGWPYLPGSGIKGVLRDACANPGMNDGIISEIFGPDTNNASDHAGGAIFTDLRLLCLPVRSYKGGFAWISSPLALSRWARDCAAAEVTISTDVDPIADCQIVLTSETKDKIGTGNDVRLEDLKLTAAVPGGDTVRKIAEKIAAACFPNDQTWQPFFTTHFGIVSDTTFSFLTRTATEITARNRIDPERKIVADGALWWEEAVPAESIFAGQLIATKRGSDKLGGADVLAAEVAKALEKPVQIGGNATVGRGLANVRLDLTATTAGVAP
ncbi:MAG: type III-B CRISPR module RAMP protein Cmr4 [Thermomicrobiales bacterium]